MLRKIMGVKFNRSDIAVLTSFAVAALAFASAAYIQYAREQTVLRLAEKGQYDASPTDVIGNKSHFRGSVNCRYILVEFGDYQCAPCRSENDKVVKLLSQHQPELGFVFRNLPLTSIHPLAMRAAVVAEKSENDVEFWTIHDYLYSKGPLTQQKILNAQAMLNNHRPLHLEYSAHEIVERDLNYSAELGIQGTPTFVLCCPKNIVRRISSLDEVAGMLSNGK